MAAGTGEFVSVRLSQLQVGATLRLPIFDAQSPRQTLLLAAGCTLTESQLRALRRRGITSVLLHHSEFERLTSTARTETLTLTPEQRHQLRRPLAPEAIRSRNATMPVGWRDEPDSFQKTCQPRQQAERDPVVCAEFERSYHRAAAAAQTVVETLVKHKELHAGQVHELSQQHLQQIRRDMDEFLVRALLPISDDYPSRHSLQTGMLACTIGTTMGLPQDDLLELAFGCLLHDTGMLLVPAKLLQSTEVFTTSQRLEVQKHPIHASNLLNHCRDVPQGARHIVYQMHERMNGSGYPRQRSGNQIHPLARIAAVADTYLALISPRPFRDALEPYQAVERILFSARQGLFDPSAVRALIHSVSLFPIGSGVTLNDGRMARVIRGNRDQFSRPVVEVVAPEALEVPGEVLNLLEIPELTIVSTTQLPELTPAQVELAALA